MYLHLGQSSVAAKREIIGIFDLEITSQSKRTRDFLSASEKAGEVQNVSADIPKSFIVSEKEGRETVFLSQLSPQTLYKRWLRPGADLG